jgi:hypothetical protein
MPWLTAQVSRPASPFTPFERRCHRSPRRPFHHTAFIASLAHSTAMPPACAMPHGSNCDNPRKILRLKQNKLNMTPSPITHDGYMTGLHLAHSVTKKTHYKYHDQD